jgi:hypothetical protein
MDNFLLAAFVSLFAIINPFNTASVFHTLSKGKIKDEIIDKSKKHYQIAIKHRENIIKLNKEIKEVFKEEIEKCL